MLLELMILDEASKARRAIEKQGEPPLSDDEAEGARQIEEMLAELEAKNRPPEELQTMLASFLTTLLIVGVVMFALFIAVTADPYY